MSSSENSPDASGYITGRIRRNDSNPNVHDPNHDNPSGHNHEGGTTDSSARSSTPAPPPVNEGTSRGPRVIRTARKRIMPPRRVTFTVPSGPFEESSESRSMSESAAPPSPAIGVPVPQPQGMTARERFWVTELADEVELHRHRLDNYRQALDELLALLNSREAIMFRLMEVSHEAREAIWRMHTYLSWIVVALVILFELLIWVMLH